MRDGEDPEPTTDGGDPACWAYLFDEDGEDGEDAPEAAPDD